MNRPQITIADAIEIAVKYSRTEHDEPYCVSAVYEKGLYYLIVYTLFQRYEFYVNASNREVIGMMSEPADAAEDGCAALCA